MKVKFALNVLVNLCLIVFGIGMAKSWMQSAYTYTLLFAFLLGALVYVKILLSKNIRESLKK